MTAREHVGQAVAFLDMEVNDTTAPIAVAAAQAHALTAIALALIEREPMAVEFVGYGGTA